MRDWSLGMPAEMRLDREGVLIVHSTNNQITN
jgi:hypothetical protein